MPNIQNSFLAILQTLSKTNKSTPLNTSAKILSYQESLNHFTFIQREFI